VRPVPTKEGPALPEWLSRQLGTEVDALGQASELLVIDCGRSDYEVSLRAQLRLVQLRRQGSMPDALVLTEHDPVITVGRTAEPDEVPDARRLARHGIALREASRGGKATYHGPGQLVGYPIMDLRDRGMDLHKHMERLQQAVVTALRRIGVHAQSLPGHRGVWVDGRKIASIGIAVRRWVTYHGFAININCDLTPFGLFTPCGIHGVEMTSLAREIDGPVEARRVSDAVVEAFAEQFGYTALRRYAEPCMTAAGVWPRIAG